MNRRKTLKNMFRENNSRKAFITDITQLGIESISYHDMNLKIRKTANLYKEKGIRMADRIAIISQNDSYTAALVLSCFYYGASAAILDPNSTMDELTHCISICKPKLVFSDTKYLLKNELSADLNQINIQHQKKKGTLFRKLIKKTDTIPDNTYPALLESLEDNIHPSDISDDSEAYILFSSGSTGKPKGISISRKSLLSHLHTLKNQFSYDSTSKVVSTLPFHHADGLIHHCVTTYFSNACCIRPETFSIQNIHKLCDSIYTFQATHFITVPTILKFLLTLSEKNDSVFSKENGLKILSTAGQLTEHLWRDFEQTFHADISNIYGLTETVCGGCFSGPDYETKKIGTIGKPVDCECRIIDYKGNNVPLNNPGELLIKGDMVFSGYAVGDTLDTSNISDGWLHTGDLATVDSEGFYSIVGRKKNIIVSGGFNIQPEEITETLLSINSITKAVTFGIEDEIMGEIPVSLIEIKHNNTINKNEIYSRLRNVLSEYKIPKDIVQVRNIPEGPSGKVKIKDAIDLYLSLKQHKTCSDNSDNVLLQTASEIFNVSLSDIHLFSGMNDIPGWDSLGHLNYISELERRLNITFTAKDIISIKTINDIKQIINNIL